MLLQHAYRFNFSTFEFAALLPGKANRGNADVFAFEKVAVLFDLECLDIQTTGFTAMRTTVTAPTSSVCLVTAGRS